MVGCILCQISKSAAVFVSNRDTDQTYDRHFSDIQGDPRELTKSFLFVIGELGTPRLIAQAVFTLSFIYFGFCTVKSL